MMYLNWFILLLFWPVEVSSYSSKARLAEWNIDNNDDVGNIIRMISRENNISRADSFQAHQRIKRMVSFDNADDRIGFQVEAASFIEKFKRTPSLGDCTLGNHRYRGDKVITPFPQVTYKYSRRSDRLQAYTYTDVIVGVGISFLGLFGASAKARVISSVKRDKKSMTIYSHFSAHKGMISLANAEVGSNWQSCTKLRKHHYLRDILTGLDDYVMVQLKFKSEEKRKETEVKLKVKFLFFSVTKTIRRIKTHFTSDFSVSVYRVTNFPKRKEVKIRFGNVNSGINYIESFEKSRLQLLKDTQAAKYDDPRLHLEYFFLPCMIKTIADRFPFKPASNFVLVELVERTNEMESVLQDIRNIKAKLLPGARKSRIENLEKDIRQRLKNTGDWKKKMLSQHYVQQLLAFYGFDRAPYYYERQLRRILGG